MQPTVVYLIRHGEPDNPTKRFYGRSVDVGLNDLGREQLSHLGNIIQQRDGGIDLLVASPLRRARESAGILSKKFGIPFITNDAFFETDSRGFEGMAIDDMIALPDIYVTPPEGVTIESMQDQSKRMEKGIEDVVRKNQGKRIGIVSHGDPISFALQRLLRGDEPSLPYKQVVKDFDPKKGNSWRMEFSGDGRLLNHEFVGSDGMQVQRERGL